MTAKPFRVRVLPLGIELGARSLNLAPRIWFLGDCLRRLGL